MALKYAPVRCSSCKCNSTRSCRGIGNVALFINLSDARLSCRMALESPRLLYNGGVLFPYQVCKRCKKWEKHTWPRACPFDGTGKRTHKNSWHCPQCTEQWSQTEADVQNYPAIFRVGECNHGAVSSGGLPSCKEPVGNMCLTLSFTHLDTGLFHWCSLLWPLVRGGTQVQIRLKLPGHMHGHLPSPTTETNAWLQEIAFAVFVLRKLCQTHIFPAFDFCEL